MALQFVDERVVVHHWLHRLSNRGLGADSVLDHAEAEIVLRHWVVYIWRQLMLESDLASVETKVWLDVVGKARALPNNLLVSMVAIRYEISSLLMKMDRIHLLVDARIELEARALLILIKWLAGSLARRLLSDELRLLLNILLILIVKVDVVL